MDVPAGVLLGNSLGATFTMSDGSHLFLRGTVDDPAVSGGPCDKAFGFSNTTFVKQ